MIHFSFTNWLVILPIGIVFLGLAIRQGFKIDWRKFPRSDEKHIVMLIIFCGLAILLLSASLPYLIAAL